MILHFCFIDNGKEKNMFNEEVDISLKDLFKTVFGKGKKIIIAFIIGCVLGGGTCFFTGNANSSSLKTKKDYYGKVLSTKKKLQPSEIEEVDNTFKTYAALQAQRNKLINNANDSSLININEKTGKELNDIYLISDSNKANTIVYAFKNLLLDNSVYDAIKKEVDQNLTQDALFKIVNIETDIENSVQVKLNNSAPSYTLSIQILGKDKANCDKISKIIKNKIQSLEKSFEPKYGNFKMINTATTYQAITTQDIIELKNSYFSNIQSITKTMSNLSSSLSDNEVGYFEALVNYNRASNQEAKFSFIKFVMFTIAFGFAFALLLILHFILKYLTEHKVHIPSDIVNRYHLPVIVKGNSASDYSVICEEIRYLISENEQIGIISSLQENTELENKITNDLGNNVVELKRSPKTEKDFSAIKSVKKIVLIETLKKSSFKDIDRLLEYYYSKGKKIEGVILLEDK